VFELHSAMIRTNYTTTKQPVTLQATEFLNLHPQFKPIVESMVTTSTINLLVLAGNVDVNVYNEVFYVPLKIVITENFPFTAPRVYINQTLNFQIQPNLDYVKNGNEIVIPYLLGWTSTGKPHNLNELYGYLKAKFSYEFPIFRQNQYQAPSYMMPPTQAPGSYQNVPYAPSNLSQPPAGYHYGQPAGSSSPYIPQPSYGNYTAPPVQPNPQVEKNRLIEEIKAKLSSKNEEYCKLMGENVISLEKVKFRMDSDTAIINSAMEDLNRANTLVGASISNLVEDKNSIVKWIGENINQNVNAENLHTFVYSKDEATEKLLNLLVKEQAYEDTLSAMKKALEKEVVTMEVFLQTVRGLCSQQFLCHVKRMKLLEYIKKQKALIGPNHN